MEDNGEELAYLKAEYAKHLFKPYHEITAIHLIERMYNNPKMVVIDVRDETNYKKFHIYGAINFPADDLVGMSRVAFGKCVSGDDPYWGPLFRNFRHCDLVLYDGSCDILPEVCTDDSRKSRFQFLFDQFLLMNFSSYRKKTNLHVVRDELEEINKYKQYMKRWNRLMYLCGGFREFCVKYSSHCFSVKAEHRFRISSDERLSRDNMLNYEIVKDRLFLVNERYAMSIVRRNMLKKLNVSALIDMRDLAVKSEFKLPEGNSTCYLPFGIKDFETQLPHIMNQIDNIYSVAGGKVYVFCDSGTGLSAAVIIAYLMAKERKSFCPVFLDMSRSMDRDLIFSPGTFEALVNLERQIYQDRNKVPPTMISASFPLRLWYLSPYYEGSVCEMVNKLCTKDDDKHLVSNTYTCIIS